MEVWINPQKPNALIKLGERLGAFKPLTGRSDGLDIEWLVAEEQARREHMAEICSRPPLDSSEDPVGIGGPHEGLGIMIGLFDRLMAVCSSTTVAENATFETPPGEADELLVAVAASRQSLLSCRELELLRAIWESPE